MARINFSTLCSPSSLLIAGTLILYSAPLSGQQPVHLKDSILVKLRPGYDSVGRVHRKIFGENYRREYAMTLKLPVLRISRIAGGLIPKELGGGFQTRSLRLSDSLGGEWVLRTVEKYPEMLLPAELRETFVKDVLRDNMSAQHPFSALVVPVLAAALGLPHTDPVIGWVERDDQLGAFNEEFAGTVCLLEQREPLGKSVSTQKMLRKLKEDHSYTIGAEVYLKLRCLDVLIGDWDRHEDQWRWVEHESGKTTQFLPVPRDRDQVFYRSDGMLQRAAQNSWFLPMMQGFERQVQDINWFLWEGREINSRWFSELDKPVWDQIVTSFCTSLTDTLFMEALEGLPEPVYKLRKDELIAQLKERRAALPELMNQYYHFFNRVVDIELSDKNENIYIQDNNLGGLSVRIGAGNHSRVHDQLIYKREFNPKVTRELRIYLHGGKDSLKLIAHNSAINIRVIGGQGFKAFDLGASNRKVRFYLSKDSAAFNREGLRMARVFRSADTSNTAYLAKDLYKRRLFYPVLFFNKDDGLALGGYTKFTNPGFRKVPYGNAQSFSGRYAFGSAALELRYNGEWLKSAGKADLLLEAAIRAPYTQNYFGMGNGSAHTGDRDIDFYRAKYSLFEIYPKLRWKGNSSAFSVGPAFQYYAYDNNGNTGRLISSGDRVLGEDSLTITSDKLYAGIVLGYSYQTIDNSILPSKGIFVTGRIMGFAGLNRAASTFAQVNAAVSFHQRLNPGAGIVIMDKIGAGATFGKPSFYQSNFLGGQGNLLGYRQYRFAGEHMLYNNFEIRMKLANFVSYILPGQFGLVGLYDIGRVWSKRGISSNVWHQGVGTGVYFAPASLSLLRFVFGHSREGWYPSFGLSFRY